MSLGGEQAAREKIDWQQTAMQNEGRQNLRLVEFDYSVLGGQGIIEALWKRPKPFSAFNMPSECSGYLLFLWGSGSSSVFASI
jgi:hypothetical protein